MNEVKQTLTEISKDLFSFSFCLIPDDLQVQQMIVDCMYLINTDESASKLLADISDTEDAAVTQNAKFKLKLIMVKNLYTMAKKRYFQVKESLVSDSNYTAFYRMEFEQRATLFLKQALMLDIEDIEYILGQDRSVVIATLSQSRQILGNNLGISNWSSI